MRRSLLADTESSQRVLQLNGSRVTEQWALPERILGEKKAVREHGQSLQRSNGEVAEVAA